MNPKFTVIAAVMFGLQGCALLHHDSELQRFETLPTATSVAFSECGRFAMLQDDTGFVAAIASLETGDVFRPHDWPTSSVVPWSELSTRYAWTSIASAPVALRVAEQNYLESLTRHFIHGREDGSCEFPEEGTLEGLDAQTKHYAKLRVRAATLQLNDLPLRFELVVTLHFVALAPQDAGPDEGCIRFAAPVTEHVLDERVMTPLSGHLAWLERDGADVVLRERR